MGGTFPTRVTTDGPDDGKDDYEENLESGDNIEDECQHRGRLWRGIVSYIVGIMWLERKKTIAGAGYLYPVERRLGFVVIR